MTMDTTTSAGDTTSMPQSTQMDIKQWENSVKVFAKDKKILQEKAEQAEQERERLRKELLEREARIKEREEMMQAEARKREEIEQQLKLYQDREKETISKKIATNISPMLETMRSEYKDTDSIKSINDLDSYLHKELENGFKCNDSKTVVEFVNVGASMMHKQASALESSYQRGKELEKQVEDYSTKFKQIEEERDNAIKTAEESKNAIKELQQKIEEMRKSHSQNIKDVDYHMQEAMDETRDPPQQSQPPPQQQQYQQQQDMMQTDYHSGTRENPQMVMATASRQSNDCFSQLLAQRNFSDWRESVRGTKMPTSMPNAYPPRY